MPDVLLQWTAHPARSRPRDLILVGGVVCLTAGAVLASLESGFLAVLAAAVLLIAIGPFLLPTRYTVTDERIEAVRAFTRRARRFSELRRVEVGRHFALVTPFARATWMDRYRGMMVLLDGCDRERVVALLREKVGAAGARP
jgi:hypothetical protein